MLGLSMTSMSESESIEIEEFIANSIKIVLIYRGAIVCCFLQVK